MAFAGTQVDTLIGPAAGPLGLEVTGVTLVANIGAFSLAADDSGAFTTDATPPARWCQGTTIRTCKHFLD